MDATEPRWRDHYKKYSYIADELPDLFSKSFPIESDKIGLFGHSLGGHGVLVVGLRNPEKFKSLSALAPCCNTSEADEFQQEMLKPYLGRDKSKWLQYDASHLVKSYRGEQKTILIDQVGSRHFL